VRRLALASVLASAAAGCEKAPSKLDKVVMERAPKGAGAVGDCVGGTAAVADIESKDILARKETTPVVYAKHVLIGWKDLEQAYRGQMDPRAKGRSQADASKLALDVLGKLKADPKAIDALVEQHGEDPGMKGGEPYKIEASTQFVPEFKNLAVRLQEGEAGIVKTTYGYHVIERVPAPPRDPLESAAILERKNPSTEEVKVQHVLIGWKGAPAARSATRTKEEADKIAKEVLDKVTAGGDMAALMKEYSEDPGSKDNGRIYDVAPDSPMVEPFKDLSLRLNVNEAGIVKSPFGWHVIKRVQPAPDALESADILSRQPVTQTAKVKHILLGWNEVNGGDPRATARTRPELEKLVKDTVDKLKKGGKVDDLMAELSEDPGSAKTATSYDVTPDAGLVTPFKNLSLRLNPGEVGVVRTNFGIHIIVRVDGTPMDTPPKAAAPEKAATPDAPKAPPPAPKKAPAPAATPAETPAPPPPAP
jgi:parvulin-like peptidyl-prolyl isomerase